MNTRSYTAGLPGCTSRSRWEEPATEELPMETVVEGLGTDWLPSMTLWDAMTRSTQRWRGKHTNREDTWSKSLDAFANEIAGGGSDAGPHTRTRTCCSTLNSPEACVAAKDSWYMPKPAAEAETLCGN